MELNKKSYMATCEAAWDLSHDGSGKQVFLRYSPLAGYISVEVFFHGWSEGVEADTVYTLKEQGASNFQQACDPDDIVEALKMMKLMAEDE